MTLAIATPAIEAGAAPQFDLNPTAHRIRTDAEAVAIARGLAARFAEGAAERDRERRLPVAELDEFSKSGLWAITVPKDFGGAGVSYVTVAEVIKTISAADSSIGQIPQNHLGVLDLVRIAASEEQKRELFALALQGKRFGNAFSEAKSKHAGIFETKIRRRGDGYVVDGEKFYSTGALFAHVVPVVASDEDGRAHLAFVDRGTPGLTVVDNWSGFGQRTTASGTVLIEGVEVPAHRVVAAHLAFDVPTANGPVSQIIQAAVDAGIAKAALDETVQFVRTQSRPWIDSGQDHAWQDPFTISAIGDLAIRLHAAEAILEKAGLAVDAAIATPTEDTVAEASVVVAEAKVLTTEIAILATNKLFELAGTRSTLGKHNLDRHWRNARTHTLHDPVRWKFHLVGNYALNGVKPPRHAWN